MERRGRRVEKAGEEEGGGKEGWKGVKGGEGGKEGLTM
jgi:hypothetical protein